MQAYRILFLLFCAGSLFSASVAYAQVDIDAGLVAHYPFDGNAEDASGNNRHGKPAGGLVLRADRGGSPDSAYDFDGIDDFVSIGNAFTNMSLPLSISVWLSPKALTQDVREIFVSNDNATQYTGFWMATLDDGTATVSYGDGGLPGPQSRRGVVSTSVLQPETWVHVTAVVSGATDMVIYVNGTAEAGTFIGDGGPAMVNGDYPAAIGTYDLGVNSLPWQGGIDDIRIYDRALSAEEVQAIYELPVGEEPLAPSVIITEIMKNPDDVNDSAGEWFELFNVTDDAIDMGGWILQDLGNESHTIADGITIQPHSTLMMCKNVERDLNGDVGCDYQYTNMALGNKEDAIILFNAEETEIDRVEYDDDDQFPSPTGATLIYTGGPEDDNNDGSNWITAFERAGNYSNLECPLCDDLGTPGTVDSGTLPVELVDFDVVMNGDEATVKWTTASETNNAGFEVYHRTADRTFERIGWVPGAGTTTLQQAYTFNVALAAPGRHGFRIKQVDFDGTFAWSKEVHRVATLERPYFIEAPYPNPYNPETSLSFSVQQDQQVTVTLVNLLGQQISTAFDGWASANTMHQVRIDSGNLASGRYLVRVQGVSFVETYAVYLVK